MGDKQSEYVSQKLLDSFYEKVANDVANNIQDTGVWAKAFAKANGDDSDDIDVLDISQGE
tara:strand:+ start:148 stop:327 length:180 start_codon:yes stop_codon:yes gene_type:complete